MNKYIYILRELREDKRLKQSDIAKCLGTTQQVYSRYETGENEIPVRYIISLAKYYNVSTDYIFGLTDEPLSKWNIKNSTK